MGNLQTGEALAAVADPAWPAILELVRAAPGAYALAVSRDQGLRTLEALQVTARSALGALALNCGGIIAGHGWFRLLGGGGDGLPSLATANGLRPGVGGAPPPMLLVGYDVLGGRFAVDGGGLGIAPGEVCYFGPDTLEWEGLGGGHAAFVEAAIGDELDDAFANLRWTGWEGEVSGLAPDQGLSLYPPPFSEEGRDVAAVSRRAVPLAEVVAFNDEAAAGLR